MSNFQLLRELNSHLPFYHVEDQEFKTYGNIITGYNFQEIQTYMEQLAIPQDGNIYVASVSEMEQTSIKEELQTHFYGCMPIQIGYCNGPNSTLNGLEYHKGSEINVAVTDLVLLLGSVQDIEGTYYHAKNVSAFFIPKGTAVELYATTLHFAPCKVQDEGFKAIVILPEGTNQPITQAISRKTAEDTLLFMTNKWLLAHPERDVLIQKGAHAGIKGENIRIKY